MSQKVNLLPFETTNSNSAQYFLTTKQTFLPLPLFWGVGAGVMYFSTCPINPTQDYIMPLNCQGPVRHEVPIARKIAAEGVPSDPQRYDKVLPKTGKEGKNAGVMSSIGHEGGGGSYHVGRYLD